jgi:multidrug efflux pump subunit AcrA (membrane-fusion protein)
MRTIIQYRRYGLVQYVLAGAVASVLAACTAKPAEAPPVVPVQVAPAIRGSIRNIVTADAILYPRDQANIMPKISAPVRRFLVQRGDRVKQGQLLAELENRDLVAAAVASRGQYSQAESNYRTTSGAAVPEQLIKAQTDLDASREAMEAAKKVIDSREQIFKQGAIARKQVDEAQVAYTQARGQFETARQHFNALQQIGKEEQLKAAAGQVETAKGQYDSAQAQVAFSEIRSPINGVVTDRPLYAGEMANPGSPILTVMDVSSLVARVSMAQDQAKEIKVGDEATLTPSDGSDPIAAKVTIVSPAVDPNSTTVQVWVLASNADGRLRAGTSVHVAIVAATIDGAIVVPSSAILPSDEGGSMVLVVDDKDIAHQKKVGVGVQEENLTQVIAGLTPGERVVTVGGLGLDDKAKVRVLKPGEKRPGEVEEKDEDKGDEK